MKLTRPVGNRKFLNAEIVDSAIAKNAGKPLIVQISKVGMKVVDDKSGDEKLTIDFTDRKLGLPLNGTNYDKLEAAYTDEGSEWVGKEVELYTEDTPMGRGVRVRPLVASGVGSSDEKGTDEIPF